MRETISEAVRSRAFLRWYMAVTAAILVGLASVVAVLLIQYAGVLSSQQQANITQCQLANVTRLQDVAIWDRLLTISPAQARAETAAQRAEVADLEHLVAVKDTPRDCEAAYTP